MKNKSYSPTIFSHSHKDEFLTPFDSLFDQLMNRDFPDFTKEFGVEFFKKGSYPKCDVIDMTDRVEIEMEIPGVNKEDISIEIKPVGQTKELVIKGKKSIDEKEEKKNYLMRELKRSAFMRSFALHNSLESDKINAEFKNGILKISIPKKESEKVEEVVTKIDIK